MALNPEIRPEIEPMAIQKYVRGSRVREHLGHGNFRTSHTCEAQKKLKILNLLLNVAVLRKSRWKISVSHVIRVRHHDARPVRHLVHTHRLV